MTKVDKFKRQLRAVAMVLGGIAVGVFSLYAALAIHYWVGWPSWIRHIGTILFPVIVLFFWFKEANTPLKLRAGAIGLLAIFFAAYLTKSPSSQDWVDLQARHATATFDGDTVTISNFRDAIHIPGQASVPRWTTQSFAISQLTSADLIIQPFGNNKAFAHVLVSFAFTDGRHVAVSIEARQVKSGKFDALAGFFRHDELYPELATERDLFWERLSRRPPDEIQIYPILRSREALQVYFTRILAFANQVDEHPMYYSTISESCMTALMKLAPESFTEVPWYDYRQYVPGYSLSLFQNVGLVDGRLPADKSARQHGLKTEVRSPQAFASDAAWSAYLRETLAARGAK